MYVWYLELKDRCREFFNSDNKKFEMREKWEKEREGGKEVGREGEKKMLVDFKDKYI